jgi:hemerythrin-like domain-containing protein
VATLCIQHDAGRQLSEYIASAARDNKRADLAKYLRTFINVYRPHEAREDTVLFPAFRKLVSDNEYMELSGQFRTLETKLFGKNGFETNVQRVALIEKELGIFDLAAFTPKL